MARKPLGLLPSLFLIVVVFALLGLVRASTALAQNDCVYSGYCYWCKRFGSQQTPTCWELTSGGTGWCKCDAFAGGCVAWEACYDPGYPAPPEQSVPSLATSVPACKVRGRSWAPVASPAWDDVKSEVADLESEPSRPLASQASAPAG